MTEFELYRSVDHSGVSGTGVVALGTEMRNGTVVLEWLGDHPSFSVWPDIREMEAVHGHDGDTVVRYLSPSDRLLNAWKRVSEFLLNEQTRPVTVGPHPDHPDRLRLTFDDAADWRYYIALMDGSSYAATHEEQAGEIRHRWIDPDGDLWLEWFSRPESTNSPAWQDREDPLEQFDREDR